MSDPIDPSAPIVCPIIASPADLAQRDPLEPAWMRIHPTFIVGTFYVNRHLARPGKLGRICRALEVFYTGLEETLLYPEAPESRLMLEGLLEATLAAQALLAEGPGLRARLVQEGVIEGGG